MADENSTYDAPQMVQDTEISKYEKMNFSFTLQLHLTRISSIRSSITTAENIDEKIWTFNELVELLEDMLAPYFDEIYNNEFKNMETNVENVDPMHADVDPSTNNILIKDRLLANTYIRKKLKACMKLMARKNLLLHEDTTLEV